MKLSVSNIAWDATADDAAAAVLVREGVRGIEIAPTKWRDSPYDASASDVAALRRRWEDRGLPIIALQSLLFGKPNLQLFAGERERDELIDHLKQVADFAAAVGAGSLVFGSPKNRLRGQRAMADAMAIARDTFRVLAFHARERGVAFCIEANPPHYGCDFVTQTTDAIDLCHIVGDPAIRVNADLGGMILSGEDPAESIARAAPFIGHVHASEPHLAELSSIDAHEHAASALASIEYSGWISIEMRAPAPDEQMQALERAIRMATRVYAGIPG